MTLSFPTLVDFFISHWDAIGVGLTAAVKIYKDYRKTHDLRAALNAAIAAIENAPVNPSTTGIKKEAFENATEAGVERTVLAPAVAAVTKLNDAEKNL